MTCCTTLFLLSLFFLIKNGSIVLGGIHAMTINDKQVFRNSKCTTEFHKPTQNDIASSNNGFIWSHNSISNF